MRAMPEETPRLTPLDAADTGADASSAPHPEILSGSVYRVLSRLAWPLVCSNLLNVSVSIVDTYFAGKLQHQGRPDTEALTSIGSASHFFDMMIILMLAIGGGTAIVVARYYGSGRAERVTSVVRDALLLAFCVASLVMIPLGYLLGRTVLSEMGITARALDLGLTYLNWRLLACPFISMTFVLGSAWVGAGDSRTPLLILLLMNLCNVILSPVLMFGLLGAPEMHVAGAAIGSLISRAIGLALAIYLGLRGMTRVRLDFGLGSIDWATLGRVVRLGLPRSLEGIVRTVTTLLLIRLVVEAVLNEPEIMMHAKDANNLAVAAFVVVARVRSIPTFIGLAFMTAVMTLVGQSLGAGSARRASQFTWAAATLSLGVMSVGAVVMFLLPGPLIRLFNTDLVLQEIGTPIFRTLAFAEPLVAVSLVLTGCLRGAGDAMWPFWVSILSQFGIAVGAGMVAVHFFGAGLQTLWLILLLSIAVRAVLLLGRFFAGRWKSIEI